MAEMGLKELERVRLILRGGGIVDWRRLHFRTGTKSTASSGCAAWTSPTPTTRPGPLVLADAVEYLRRTFSYRVADAVARPAELHDLFLYASGVKEPLGFAGSPASSSSACTWCSTSRGETSCSVWRCPRRTCAGWRLRKVQRGAGRGAGEGAPHPRVLATR